jgi:hypothetical protein
MTNATHNREPDWGSYPPELRRIIDIIRQHGSDGLSDMQRMLVVQVFRTAAMTTEPRVIQVCNKMTEAHLEYCFRLPAQKRMR